jgi:PTH1 family peptidyl-tRNA hydrolase
MLILGLGNPGDKYKNTRHNVGFMVLDSLAEELGEKWSDKPALHADIIETNIEGTKVILAKPQTFMNLSGESAAAIAKHFNVDIEDIWVVYDDVDLDLGTIRVREKGSAGGHNGIKSLLAHLGGEQFIRFRIGVDAPPENIPLEKWVLSTFSEAEQKILSDTIVQITKKVLSGVTNGITPETEKRD